VHPASAPQSSIQQHRQYKKLREVAQLANEIVEEMNPFGRGVRQKPLEKWLKQWRGIVGRKAIARKH